MLVSEKLAGQNYPVYLPLINKARLHHGTKSVTPFPMTPGSIFLAAGDLERSEPKKLEKKYVQLELLCEKSEEKTLIRVLNALRQFEILAQTEEVLINPGIQLADQEMIGITFDAGKNCVISCGDVFSPTDAGGTRR